MKIITTNTQLQKLYKMVIKMLPQEIFNELKEMAKGGSRHRYMVDYLKKSNHMGYDISDDETLIVAYFNGVTIILAPYHVLKLIVG